MRVLHVVGNLDAQSGGNTAAAAHTCGFLRELGVDAELAGTWTDSGSAEYLKAIWPTLPIHGFPRRLPRHYWNSPGLRRWLRASLGAFDLLVVHGVFNFPFTDAARVASRLGVPYIVQPHNSLDPYDLRKHRVLKSAYGPLAVRRFLRNAARVLVTTTREAERLVTYGAEPVVSVVPLPVPPGDASPASEGFRRAWAIGDEASVVLFLGRLDPKKAIERALQALRHLRATNREIRLVIAGSTDQPRYERRLKQLATDLGLDDAVTWTGLLLGNDKWAAFAASDLFVLPSNYENFGITVIEALGTGMPVVISHEVAVADDLAGSSAVFVCGTDVDSLVAQIRDALDDQRRDPEALAAAARDAVTAYEPHRVATQTLKVYEGVLGTRSH